MKVRWTSDSIRFRITPGELEQLRAGQRIGITLRVPGSAWEAAIIPADTDTSTTLCGAEPSGFTVYLASPDRDRLCEPTIEGVYFRTLDEEASIRYFIEKDFPCVHPRPAEAEEETETFAPPPGFAERHKTNC